ncbi:MAG: hypothetical protein COA73_14705 [Candidatus Hydrogenedentota bacterium]|nr:MAG: hypothetical protein COA73_14705 [Candidatus Hydrogenedentota bacterium]
MHQSISTYFALTSKKGTDIVGAVLDGYDPFWLHDVLFKPADSSIGLKWNIHGCKSLRKDEEQCHSVHSRTGILHPADEL